MLIFREGDIMFEKNKTLEHLIKQISMNGHKALIPAEIFQESFKGDTDQYIKASKVYKCFYTKSLDSAFELLEILGLKKDGWFIDEISRSGRLAGEPWGAIIKQYKRSDIFQEYWDYEEPSLPLLIVCLKAYYEMKYSG